MSRRKGEPIKCEHCGYEWKTRSKHFYVTCPRCLKKTPTPHKPSDDEQ